MYECMYECMNVWMYECMNVWMYEFMNVWMYDCMNVWLYGCICMCDLNHFGQTLTKNELSCTIWSWKLFQHEYLQTIGFSTAENEPSRGIFLYFSSPRCWNINLFDYNIQTSLLAALLCMKPRHAPWPPCAPRQPFVNCSAQFDEDYATDSKNHVLDRTCQLSIAVICTLHYLVSGSRCT